MPTFELPDQICAELRAAQARLVSRHDASDGRRFEVWGGGRDGVAAIVLAELHSDGKVFLWQPLTHGEAKTMPNTAAELRRYLGGTASEDS